MVKIYFNCESRMDSEDGFALFRVLRTGGGTPMGGLEEPSTGAWGGLRVLEFNGMARYREEEPNELSIIDKNSN
jgi:hypothetical protein